jgi:hypothetical protein
MFLSPLMGGQVITVVVTVVIYWSKPIDKTFSTRITIAICDKNLLFTFQLPLIATSWK